MAFSRSLVPSMLGRNWWDVWDFPPSIYDQDFGLGLLEQDLIPARPRYIPRALSRSLSASQGRRTGISEVRNDPNKFQVMLDVSHFSPEEISVKTTEDSIVIRGKHEERADQHGFISREFTRRYVLPKEVDPATVTSSLSPDGVLVVEAPKKALEPPSPNERPVPITLQSTPLSALPQQNVPQTPSNPEPAK